MGANRINLRILPFVKSFALVPFRYWALVWSEEVHLVEGTRWTTLCRQSRRISTDVRGIHSRTGPSTRAGGPVATCRLSIEFQSRFGLARMPRRLQLQRLSLVFPPWVYVAEWMGCAS